MNHPDYTYTPRGPGGYAVERVSLVMTMPGGQDIFTARAIAWEPDQAGAENVAAGANAANTDTDVSYRVVAATAHNTGKTD